MSAGRYFDGYWCEAVARSVDLADTWRLSAHRSHSPEHALVWLRDQALRLADALGHEPPFGATANIFRDWAADHAYQRVQLTALAGGQPISANACGPDRIHGQGRDIEVLYSLSARPINRDATTRRLLRAL
ncbi:MULTISPECIES: hypothetical protein [unclassified Streptomyces]|uniref:hypothetical protein n=1 Tax=unclassified Streptomyces TaxID=2593676 RepID=UPI000CD519BA|nr:MULTISPECIES: hypothetical protein [unclassified Streptomyces]